jgi:hypothetical protein
MTAPVRAVEGPPAVHPRPVACAIVSSGLEEPLAGTVGWFPGWVLLEQPGPWGAVALLESRLDPSVGGVLKERADDLGLRVLLIRRPGRYPVDRVRPRAFLAWTDPRENGQWIEARTLDDPAEILDADLVSLAAGRRPGFGADHPEPLYLVCTNGKVDACCASFGRRTASALASARPAETWESSHVGGDRFAPNVVCLPHGIYYGHVEPEEAESLARGYEGGRLDVDHLRGRAAWPMGAQAAEWFVRQRSGLDRLDAVRLVEWTPEESHEDEEMADGTAVFALGDVGRVIVEVGTRDADPPRRITCASVEEIRPREWILRSLRGLPERGGGAER